MSSNTGSAAKKMKPLNRMLGYPDIPEVVLFYEILPRLPVKQILRFRTVCKCWCRLTNEFFFITNQTYHSIHSSSNQSVFMYPNRDGSLSVVSFEELSQYRLPPLPSPYPSWTPTMMYQGTCAGLVYGHTSFDILIFVYNLITRRIIFVENCHDDLLAPHGLALAFDHPPFTTYASPELMRFKLICPIDNVHNVTFKVYCSARKEWHDTNAYVELDSKPFDWGSQFTQSNVFVKGNVYWFDDKFMVWFNVNEEVAGTILLPTNHRGITGAIADEFISASVGACNGELSYCNITKDSKLTVWLRRNEWEKVREVSFDTIIKDNWDVLAPHARKQGDFVTAFYRGHIVYTMSYEGGDMLMFWVVSEEGRGARAFGINSKTMELKELSAPGLNTSFSAYPYKAILLKNQNGDENEL
ncbi:hypothetical protein Syun_018125 [Stephania yunnanensis]|uniref:F-box domain-containing protein n=1 Tax=Stephania yunnanensis TaxID=152371 RepID=A0AAP0IRP2_9MAGN